jgi:hypothetical protein
MISKLNFEWNDYSFGDIYKYTVYNDLKIVFCGYIIMFLYVAIMLGRFNMIEQRVRTNIVSLS